MCGIAGIINYNQRPVGREELKQMTDRMKYRGPDDEGFFVEGYVGLGMRRLSIIDVGGGHQPISNEDGTVWVVMNGEIYNYVELRRDLQARGHTFRTNSDTEVLVHGYEEKGTEFINELNGMFAFALYDKKKAAVWIARDRLGIKPLYYANPPGRFLFSSDLNTFPKELRHRIDPDALLLYFGYGYVPTPYTIYQGIKKLPPAYWVWVKDGQVDMSQYWSVHDFQTATLNYDEAQEKLTELLKDSIRLQLRSDVPLGVMLSGGVDSSAVTAIAARSVELPVNTFTINFIGKAGQDSKYARMVAEQYHTNHREIPVQPADLLKELDEVLAAVDEPIFDSAIVPTYLIAKSAREHGVKVMLSGAGGDELFGGYRRHFKPRFGSPTWVAEHFPAAARKVVGSLWAVAQPHRGFRAQDPGIAYLAGIFGADLGFYRSAFKDKDLFQVFFDLLKHSAEAFIESASPTGYHYRRMYFDLRHYLVDNILSLTDKATMATSVEGRVPLLDHRLVEFAFSIPEEINIKNGEPKGLFKSALEPYLPAVLLNRPKEGFNAPITGWMDSKFYDTVRNELKNNPSPALTEALNPNILLQYTETTPAQSFLSGTLYSLYVLNRWLCKRGL